MLLVVLVSVITILIVMRLIILLLPIGVVCGLVRNVARFTQFCHCFGYGFAHSNYATGGSGVQPVQLEILLVLLISVIAFMVVVRILMVLPVVVVCGPDRNVGSSGNFCNCGTYGRAVFNYAVDRRGGVRTISHSVRNVGSSTQFCNCHSNGYALSYSAANRLGIRPRFWVININGSQDIKVKPTKEDYFYAFTI